MKRKSKNLIDKVIIRCWDCEQELGIITFRRSERKFVANLPMKFTIDYKYRLITYDCPDCDRRCISTFTGRQKLINDPNDTLLEELGLD
jgi:hypothetical protein